MNVRLVASAVGGNEPNQFLTTYLVNDTLAIDAGCVGLFGSPRDQARIKHILLSHSHLDHLASLPVFVENVYEGNADCVTIHGSDAVLDSLRQHVFNDRVFPDFPALSSEDAPFLKLARLEAGRGLELEGVRITPVAVDHVVPTLGFILEEDATAVVIASDTGPTEEIWKRANDIPHLKGVFLEATFPRSLDRLARISKHLTSATFARETRKLTRTVPIIAVHLKARYRAQIVQELQDLNLPNVEIGIPGKEYQF